MRMLIRLVVLVALVIGGYFLLQASKGAFGTLASENNIVAQVHFSNCSAAPAAVGEREQPPVTLKAQESRDIDNGFWGYGWVRLGTTDYHYPAPTLPAEMRPGGKANLFLQLDDGRRIHLATGSGCEAARVNPQPPGFPLEPQ